MTNHSENTKTATCDNNMLANRLFKFRLWNGIKIISDKELFNDKYTIEQLNWNKYYTMQFTGFTDKKEIEIYEGDICKYHKNTSKWLVSYHFEVRFKNGAFYAYWEREMMGKLEQHWDLLSQKDMRNIRVVSNIFQSTQTTS